MAGTFGLLGGAATPAVEVTGLTVNGIDKNSTCEIATALNEYGQVMSMNAFSQTKEVSVDGVVSGSVTAEAGNVLSYDGKDYILKTVNLKTINTDYQKLSGTATLSDDCSDVTAYVKGA
jgi:hypothetical protein